MVLILEEAPARRLPRAPSDWLVGVWGGAVGWGLGCGLAWYKPDYLHFDKMNDHCLHVTSSRGPVVALARVFYAVYDFASRGVT